MAIKIAINGFGRIGRLVFRLMDNDPQFEIVAINDLSQAEDLAYLLKYDTAQKRYKEDIVTFSDDMIVIGEKNVKVYAEKDPANLPWGELGIDVVFECTGLFTDFDKANVHILAGAKKVLISAPGKGDMKTIVFNVNHNILDGSETVISCASCTTNCLAPVLKVLDDNFKINRGLMTTVHAYTNDQATLDVAHKKGIASRRGRAAAANIVPTSTGAASAVGEVLPTLKGKLDGIALRVPVITGSVVDLTIELDKKVTKEEINEAFKKNANGTLKYTDDPIVSSDVIGTYCGATIDGLSTSVLDTEAKQLIKIIAWYDNEMGYSAQMVRTAKYIGSLMQK